jgi:glucose/arabinose dehydrogenase
MRRSLTTGGVGVALAVAALGAPGPVQARLVSVGRFHQPVDATAPRGDAHRLFVLERAGVIKLLNRGATRRRAFLDIRRLVRVPYPRNQFRDQSGAFAFAFAPGFRRSGLFYVLYTGRDKQIHVDEFRARGASASIRSRRTVLTLPEQGLLDVGGDLAFGPDGLLYASFGEGRVPAQSQDLGSLNGKLIRIDPRVTAGASYGIPATNPFVARPGARPEIFASGVRTPYRFSFSGRNLILADVGESSFEEVDVLDTTTSAGADLGWPVFEGPHRREPATGDFVAPVFSRRHVHGFCAIVGGAVVHGRYLYGDVCAGRVRSVRLTTHEARGDRSEHARVPYLDSFGRDGRGRPYAVSLNGAVYRLAP